MGCVASMPTATKGSFSKSNAVKVGGKICSRSELFAGHQQILPGVRSARTQRSPVICPCRRLTRSLRMDSLSQQSQRQACVRLSLKLMLSCKLTLLVQIVCFENTAHNNENDTTFVLQASPYDTRKLANPKDVMPYLPEACGDICQVMSPWPGCGKPANEAERLAATEKLQLIGKEPHPALQRYVDLISTCYQVLPPGPICLQACCHHKRPRLASLLCTTSSLNSVTALQSIHNHHVLFILHGIIPIKAAFSALAITQHAQTAPVHPNCKQLMQFCLIPAGFNTRSHLIRTLLLCLQRQLVLLSLFDTNCAQIINTSAGELPAWSVLRSKQSPPVLRSKQSPQASLNALSSTSKHTN